MSRRREDAQVPPLRINAVERIVATDFIEFARRCADDLGEGVLARLFDLEADSFERLLNDSVSARQDAQAPRRPDGRPILQLVR